MKRFELENKWVRILLELFPRALPMRRYRLAHEEASVRIRGRIVRRISRQLRDGL
jgi:hypothetical protein